MMRSRTIDMWLSELTMPTSFSISNRVKRGGSACRNFRPGFVDGCTSSGCSGGGSGRRRGDALQAATASGSGLAPDQQTSYMDAPHEATGIDLPRQAAEFAWKRAPGRGP